MSCKTILQLCALLATTCFSNCKPSYSSESQLIPDFPGNQYFTSRTAKFLGSDSTEGKSRWLIDSSAFDSIRSLYHGITTKEAMAELEKLPKTLIHFNDSIQLLLQLIRDSSAKSGFEHQMLVYLDVNSGNLSAILGETGSNHGCGFLRVPANHASYLSETDHASPHHRLILAQAHGHPGALEDSLELLPAESDSDRCVAWCLQGPVYPVIATDSRWGASGPVCRVVPVDIHKNTNSEHVVGHTQGGLADKKSFDVGLDALMVWSISPYAQPDCNGVATRQTSHALPTTPSSQPPPQ